MNTLILYLIMNWSTRSSKNLFRQRSISSIPSRQISVMNIISQRESVIAILTKSILNERRKFQQQKSAVLIKDNEISKLRKNLETAVSTALYEKLQNSKNKDEINEFNHMKKFLQSKIKQYEKDLKEQREKYSISIIKNEQLSSSIDVLSQKCQELQIQLKEKSLVIDKQKGLFEEIEHLKLHLKDIQPLKSRIITLEGQVREEKLIRKNAQIKVKAHEKKVQSLQEIISKTKPRQQQLKQRIAYFQRVNLDLQRKMDDYNRRENDYIKQITSLKFILAKVTSERNHFKTVYEQTLQKLEKKVVQYDQLIEQNNKKVAIIQDLQQQLQAEKKIGLQLRQQIEGKNSYYKRQGQQNILLKQKNQLLQTQQFQLRKVIESYLRIADEVNLTIVQRIQEIKKLKQVIQNLKTQLHITEQKFSQFDKLVEQGSEKGINQIRDNFYSLIRANNDLTTLVKEQRIAFDQKVITFGQERDNILRNHQVRKVEPPTDETQLLSIFHQKTQSLLLIQKSNDQLLKIKKELEAKIQELYGEIEKQKRQMNILKLKTADLFRAKKQLEDARKSIHRYQEMIQEDKLVIDDIKSQVSVLRQRNNQLNQKNFVVQLQRRNLDIKVKEMNEVMKQLNVQTLMVHKQLNEKNNHLFMDSLQKLESAIKSLTFFFYCAFCGELPSTPITLALCGHNYCTKCKQAYAESCYQCDTGQPIQKVFQNKFLKDAGGKYKFLTMVLAQLKANFQKKQ